MVLASDYHLVGWTAVVTLRVFTQDDFELPRPVSPPIITRTAFNATRKFTNKRWETSLPVHARTLSDALGQLDIPTVEVPFEDEDENPSANDLL